MKYFIKKLPSYLFLTIILIMTVFPLVYTILASFKTNQEIITGNATLFPKTFTLENYKAAWSDVNFNVPILLKNSIWYSICTVILQLVTTSLAGYVFARGHFTGQKVVFAIITSLMFVNLGGATTVPTLKIINSLGLGGSLWGLILMKAFGINVAGIFMVRSYIQTLPKELDEAASIDGCGFLRVFVKIIAPLLQPVLITIGILAFNASWNETIMPTIFTLSRPDQRTLSAGLYALKNMGDSATQWNLMLAGSVIAMVPVLVTYAIANKYFVEGLSSGAVKG